jgi:hypothetical protein
MALHTITSKHRDLQQIVIMVPYHISIVGADSNAGKAIGEANFGQWLDLDRLLVQLWESRSVRPKIICVAHVKEGRYVKDCVGRLLPEITGGGIIDLAEHLYESQ